MHVNCERPKTKMVTSLQCLAWELPILEVWCPSSNSSNSMVHKVLLETCNRTCRIYNLEWCLSRIHHKIIPIFNNKDRKTNSDISLYLKILVLIKILLDDFHSIRRVQWCCISASKFCITCIDQFQHEKVNFFIFFGVSEMNNGRAQASCYISFMGAQENKT